MQDLNLLFSLSSLMLHSSLRCQQNLPTIQKLERRHYLYLYDRSILLTFLLNYQMYNSEEVYTFEENKQTQSHAPSTDQVKNARLNNSRPKNGLQLGQKSNGIYGTYARIVPKKPLHDMQRLYAENIQLREKIRFLQEDGTKIKTRMQMAQKQRQQLITQLCNTEYGNNVLKDRRPSQKGLIKSQDKTSKLGLDENRRILHGYKDEISKLKLQNGRLKKTVKYTQIQQLETQNQLLHEEMVRLKKYMKEVIENTEYDQYEKQIEKLNSQVQAEKDSKKSLMMQLKKKDEEMEQVKNKMKIIANRKTELEKKYNRQMINVKGELHRAKEREKQYFVTSHERKQTSKPKVVEKMSECRNCLNYKQNLQNERKKNQELENKLQAKQKQIGELQNKLKQQNQMRNSKISQKSPTKDQNQNHVQTSDKTVPKQNKLKQEQKNSKDKFILEDKNQLDHKQNEEKQHSKQNIGENTSALKQDKSHEQQQDSKYSEDQYDEDENQQDEADQLQNGDQSEDKVDVLHINMDKNQKNLDKTQQNASNNHKKKNSEADEKYDQSFNQSKLNKKKINENDSQQEVLFQKQQKNKSKKEKSQKKKQEENPKQKQKVTGTKAQKILKQTIKYRLMAQRYCYKDFHRDIKDSGATDFTVEELISMLTNQPFFLSEDHLKMVLFSLFEKEQLNESDTTTVNSFLKKMKILIGDFDIRDQEEQQIVLKSIQNKLSKKKLLSKMKEQASNGKQISKKGFVKVLKQNGGLNDDQIEQCLAQASVISIDIAHINYVEFLQKLSHS